MIMSFESFKKQDIYFDIKNCLFDHLKNFNCINYLNVKLSRRDITVEIEIYEDEYVLETLNNPDAIKNTFDNFRCLSISALVYDIYINYNFIDKKRTNYNHDNMYEMIFIDEEFNIQYI